MEYLIHLAILSSIFAILAISLDLVLGYTGLLSVTHAAFYGIGAYVSAPLSANFMLPVPDASMPAVDICSERSAAGTMISASETL